MDAERNQLPITRATKVQKLTCEEGEKLLDANH